MVGWTGIWGRKATADERRWTQMRNGQSRIQKPEFRVTDKEQPQIDVGRR